MDTTLHWDGHESSSIYSNALASALQPTEQPCNKIQQVCAELFLRFCLSDRPVLSKGNIECSTHSGNYLWEGEGALDLLRLPHFLPDPSYTIPMGGKLVQPSHEYSFQTTINIHDWITGRKMGGWDKECLRAARAYSTDWSEPAKTVHVNINQPLVATAI